MPCRTNLDDIATTTRTIRHRARADPRMGTSRRTRATRSRRRLECVRLVIWYNEVKLTSCPRCSTTTAGTITSRTAVPITESGSRSPASSCLPQLWWQGTTSTISRVRQGQMQRPAQMSASLQELYRVPRVSRKVLLPAVASSSLHYCRYIRVRFYRRA